MAWPIYLLVACLVQSQVLEIRAYPAAEVTSAHKNSTVEGVVKYKVDIAVPNNHAHHASAVANTTAEVKVINPDGENNTALSTTSSEILPEDAVTSEKNVSNVHLNMETKVFMEILEDGEIVTSTSTILVATADDDKGEYANSTSEVHTDSNGNQTVEAKSTMSSNGDDNTEEAEGEELDIIMETIIDVYMPEHGKNMTAEAGTKTDMVMFEIDGTNSTVESYSIAKTNDDFNGSTTVTDLGDGMIEMDIKTKIVMKLPPVGLPKAAANQVTHVDHISSKGKTSYSETESNVSVDGSSDDFRAGKSGVDEKLGDKPSVKQAEDAIAKQSDDASAKKDDKAVKQDDKAAKQEHEEAKSTVDTSPIS